MTHHKRETHQKIANEVGRDFLNLLAQTYPDRVFVPRVEVRYSRYYDHMYLDYHTEEGMSEINCGLRFHKDGVTLCNGSVSFQIDVPEHLWTAHVELPYTPNEGDWSMRTIERSLLTKLTSLLRAHGLELETP